MDHPHEIIDAFVDGETIDPAGLKSALRREAGIDYLVDALILRDIASDGVAANLTPADPRRHRRWVAFATAVLLAAAAGFVAGARTPLGRGTDLGGIAADAPPPTRIIQLEPGVNWTETSGGN